jgi:hypothetical protein
MNVQTTDTLIRTDELSAEHIGMQTVIVIDGKEFWTTVQDVRRSAVQGVEMVTEDGVLQSCFGETVIHLREAHWGGTYWAYMNVGD